MTETLSEIWGELYWNTTDWLPWLAIQAIVPAVIAAVVQRWLGIRWPYVFLSLYAVLLPVNYSRLPPSAISRADVAKWNAGLPRAYDGVILESVSFAHRVLTFHGRPPNPVEANDVDESLVTEQCQTFGDLLAARHIKQIRYEWSWSEGSYTRTIEAEDCQS